MLLPAVVLLQLRQICTRTRLAASLLHPRLTHTCHPLISRRCSFLKEECLKNDTLAKILRDDSASREILQASGSAGGRSRWLRQGAACC